LNVQFNDSSVGGGGSAIVSRQWAFGDGATNVGNNPSPSNLYALAGSFTVSLKVIDGNGCDTSIAIPNFVNTSIPPNGVITTSPNPALGCTPPLNVTFSAAASTSNSTTGSGLTYLWNFGTGNTSTVVNPPVVTYNTSGTFNVTLIVYDNNNCPDTTTSQVIISSPFASFFAVGAVNDTVCRTVTFRNQSLGTNAFYTYGDGASGTDSIHTYAPGTYQVTLQVQNGICTDDTTITIHVENVVAAFTSTPHYSCNWPFTVQYNNTATNGATFLWTFGDGSTSTQANPTHTFLKPDTNQYTIYDYYYYTDQLTVTSVHGCSATVTKARNDTVFNITARFMPDKSYGCAPLTVTFSDSSRSREPIVNYTYLFGDGNQTSGSNPVVSHTYNTAGIYYVRLVVTNSVGCKDTSFIIPIYVGTPITSAFTVVPNSICPNTPVQLTVLNPDTNRLYHFSGDGGILSHCFNQTSPVWNFNTQTGSQPITLTTSYNGCTGTATQNVTVKGPMARFYVAGNCNTPFTYNFPATIQDANTWNWDFGDGNVLINSGNNNPSHTYAVTGDYWVKLTAFNSTSGCSPSIDSSVVRVRNIQANFIRDSIVCKNQTVNVNAQSSTDAYGFCNEGYLWYWNDGTHPHNSASPSYTHTFSTNGTYYIKLVVTDINGCVDSIKKKVDVYSVNAYFKSNKNYGCLPLTVNFTDSSFADTLIASYSWNFGDGNISTVKNPTHTFTTVPPSGFWVVTLTVRDTIGCTSTYSKIITPSLPDTLFSTPKGNVCVGEPVQFNPNFTGHQSYLWNFGDNGTSTQIAPTHAYANAGSYTVTLTVTDSIGCTGTKKITNYINVQAYPQAGFVSSADSILNKCYPLLVNYYDTSIVSVFGSRQWNLGNSSNIFTTPVAGTIYQNPGTYIIQLIVSTTFGCRDTTYDTLKVVGPVGNFNIVPTTICKGQSITFSIKDTADLGAYSWDFGDGSTAAGISPITHTFNINPASGQTLVGLVMWSPDSACTYTKTNPVYIRQVIADFTVNNGDTALCIGEPITLTNTSLNASSNFWNLGNGQTYNGINPPPFSISQNGIYTLSLAIDNTTWGCKDTIRKKISINNLPVAYATGGDTCLGQPITLSASGGVSYLWSPSTGLSSTTVANPVATPGQSTVYSVVVTDINGCTDVATAPVVIYSPPPQVNNTYLLFIGDSVQLNTGIDNHYIITWNPVAGLSCITCPNPWAQPLTNTLYTATYTDSLGCYTGVSRFNIEIDPRITIDVPTAFTPNGDGDNDVIFVKGLGLKRLIEFKIYNRWGQLLFESNDLNKGWDGYYKGELQNVETYVYTAKAEAWLNGKTVSKKGTFNLLR
jgi:gliding motility-associated-like protein